jgi:hypothetical protein
MFDPLSEATLSERFRNRFVNYIKELIFIRHTVAKITDTNNVSGGLPPFSPDLFKDITRHTCMYRQLVELNILEWNSSLYNVFAAIDNKQCLESALRKNPERLLSK